MTPKEGKTYIEKGKAGEHRVLIVRQIVGKFITGHYWHFDTHRLTPCQRIPLDGFGRRFELSPVQISPDLVV